MHWLAMITMLIDHIGAVFFPGSTPWRMIGRIAFPIYAFALYMGYVHTRNLTKYMLRLGALALISQLPFMLAFDTNGLNVVWTLLASLGAIALADRMKRLWLVIPMYIVVGLLMEASDMDYAAYGLLLVLIYRYGRGFWMIPAHLMLNLLYEMRYSLPYGELVLFEMTQHLSLISTILIVTLRSMPSFIRPRVPRWLWVSFYPLHLAIIVAVRYYLDYNLLMP